MLGSDVLLCFIFYSTLLILKMYIIAIITGQVRLRKKVSCEAFYPKYFSLLQTPLATRHNHYKTVEL